MTSEGEQNVPPCEGSIVDMVSYYGAYSTGTM